MPLSNSLRKLKQTVRLVNLDKSFLQTVGKLLRKCEMFGNGNLFTSFFSLYLYFFLFSKSSKWCAGILFYDGPLLMCPKIFMSLYNGPLLMCTKIFVFIVGHSWCAQKYLCLYNEPLLICTKIFIMGHSWCAQNIHVFIKGHSWYAQKYLCLYIMGRSWCAQKYLSL